MLLVGSNIRWEAPLIATRVRKVARKGGKVFAIGPEVDLGMKVEWLGDDLKLLGKLPKAVKDAFAKAERPAVIVGGGALAAGAQGAALALVEPLGLIKDGWNGYNVLHFSASRMAGLILGYAQPGGIADIEAASPSWSCCSAPTKSRPTGSRARSRSTSATTATMARKQADLVLPGAAYAEKHGTYVNTEGRVQRGEKAAFAPGEAREDWAILRAVSELAGKKLPFDSFAQLRAADDQGIPAARPRGPDRPAMVAAQARRQGRRPDPLPDRRLLPDQRHLPQQPDDAALLRRAGARRPVPGGGGMTATSSPALGLSYDWAWFSPTVIGILVIALPLMLAVAMIIYAERKIWAAIALRRGPNVVGPWGLLQSFADGLKVFLKETIIPTSANKGLFLIAPIVTFTVALIVWAVVPFQPGVVLADVNVGLLYVLAASSLGVYGVIVAGWASNSKYPFFSALRAAAQMVSYEVSIGFVLITVVLYAGTFNLSGIVLAQKGHGLGIVNAFAFNLLLFPMWVVFFISSMAETFRTPFDLVEAESELVAGHQTEYSSMSFALFWLGEYANVILMCALNAIIFWGGWLPPVDWAPLYWIPGIIWLFAKMRFFFFCFGWVKATVPRYRYDQLMRLGWKIFLPLSLIFVVLVSGWLMLTRYGGPAA